MCKFEFSINSSSVNKVDQGLFTRSISECELREGNLYFECSTKSISLCALIPIRDKVVLPTRQISSFEMGRRMKSF